MKRSTTLILSFCQISIKVFRKKRLEKANMYKVIKQRLQEIP